MKFEWDEQKELRNIAKHNIDFERAKTVFNDEKAVYLFDEAHSQDEERFNNKLNQKVVVPLGTDVYDYYSELAKANGEDIANLLKRCLTC